MGGEGGGKVGEGGKEGDWVKVGEGGQEKSGGAPREERREGEMRGRTGKSVEWR